MKNHHMALVFLVVLGVISLCSGIVAGEQDNISFGYVDTISTGQDNFNPCSISFGRYMYVTDPLADKPICIFDKTTGKLLSRWGVKGSSYPGQFDRPYGIAADGTTDNYIADTYNSRVQKWPQDTATYPYDGQIPWSDQLSAFPMAWSLPNPKGLAWDIAVRESVFVTDTANDRVVRTDKIGWYAFSWGEEGDGNGQFRDPKGIAISDDEYTVFVVDSGNNRIQKFDEEGDFILKWGSEGTGAGQFRNPTGIAYDGNGVIYVVDTGNDRIQRFDTNGNYRGSFGSTGSGEGQFRSPYDIVVKIKPGDEVGDWVYVTDTGNHRIQIFEDRVVPPSLAADFTAEPMSGTAPLKVTFTDTSTGNPEYWNYNFGDGTSSSSKNPVHTYRTAGNYTVTLTVRKLEDGRLRNSTAEKHIIVTGGQGPVQDLEAGFTADPVIGKAPLKVTFSDTSTGSPQFWNYNFGDGTSSSSKNPVHTYSTPGNYTVTLTVRKVTEGLLVKSTAEKQIVVSGGQGPVQDLVAGFTADPVTGKAPLKVTFTDASTGNPEYWTYKFGDGTAISSKNPVHTYLSPGSYTVTLTVMKTVRGVLVKNTTVSQGLITVQ